jgi:hypothetical protein
MVMQEEMAALILDNGTWEVVDLPAGHFLIGLMWALKLKKNTSGRWSRTECPPIAMKYGKHNIAAGGRQHVRRANRRGAG